MTDQRTVDLMSSLTGTVVIAVADSLPVVFGVVFGAMFASFFCVVYERVPKHMTLQGRSYCVCGRQLKSIENIPVFGWLSSMGTARCCDARIPVSYFLAEIAGAVLVGLAVLLGGFLLATAVTLLAGLITYGVALRRTDGSGQHTPMDDAGTEGRNS